MSRIPALRGRVTQWVVTSGSRAVPRAAVLLAVAYVKRMGIMASTGGLGASSARSARRELVSTLMADARSARGGSARKRGPVRSCRLPP